MSRYVHLFRQEARLPIMGIAGSGGTDVTLINHAEVVTIRTLILFILSLLLVTIQRVHLRVISSRFLRLIQNVSNQVAWVGPSSTEIEDESGTGGNEQEGELTRMIH